MTAIISLLVVLVLSLAVTRVALGVSRYGSFLGLPAGETVIRSHDTLVVYGKTTEVSDLDAGGIEVAGEATDA